MTPEEPSALFPVGCDCVLALHAVTTSMTMMPDGSKKVEQTFVDESGQSVTKTTIESPVEV